MTKNRIIREAILSDMTEIMRVIVAAKEMMRQSGNLHQWVNGYPSEDVIMADGIFKDIMDFCFSHEANIRIDTHKDNHIMQHNIKKHGFTYCGIIFLANGDERLAYQHVNKLTS